ncbi:hypothetical protein D3C78_1421030 [compost metagenome]
MHTDTACAPSDIYNGLRLIGVAGQFVDLITDLRCLRAVGQGYGEILGRGIGLGGELTRAMRAQRHIGNRHLATWHLESHRAAGRQIINDVPAPQVIVGQRYIRGGNRPRTDRPGFYEGHGILRACRIVPDATGDIAK